MAEGGLDRGGDAWGVLPPGAGRTVDGSGIGGTFAKGPAVTAGSADDAEAKGFAGALKTGIWRPLACSHGSFPSNGSVGDEFPVMNTEKVSRGAWNDSSSQGGIGPPGVSDECPPPPT